MDVQLSLRRLEVFKLVVEERSVTRAAEVLMVAQPAVTAQLRSLEQWAGAKLVARQGNKLVLTEAGERTYQWAKATLASAAQIRRDVGDLEAGVSGGVTVSSSLAVGTYLLPPVLAQLGKDRPGAEICITIAPPDEVLRSLEIGECDFAVLNWDERELPDTLASRLLRIEPLLVCAPPELAASGRQLTLDEVFALPFVGAPKGVVYQRNLMAQIRDLGGPTPRVMLRLGHAESMKRVAIEQGFAVILPAYTVSKELADGSLCTIDAPEVVLQEHIMMVWRREKIFSPLQNAAIEAVLGQIGRPSHASG